MPSIHSTSLTDLLFACVASLIAVIAAFTDLRSRAIPNVLTLPVLSVAPLVHGFLSGPGALGHALLSAAACVLVPLLAFARGGMGGGDVKLFAALGALLGMQAGLRIELTALLLAAMVASFALAGRGELLRTLARSARLIASASAPLPAATSGAEVRLGPAIAAATLLSLWLGALVS